MIIKCCQCNKFLGIKKLFQKGVSHGLCQDCLERQLFKIKGYLFKWILYKGYNAHKPVLSMSERILAHFLGIVAAYLIYIVIIAL